MKSSAAKTPCIAATELVLIESLAPLARHQALTKLLQRQPELAEGWLALAELYHSTERHDEALAAARRGVEIDPDLDPSKELRALLASAKLAAEPAAANGTPSPSDDASTSLADIVGLSSIDWECSLGPAGHSDSDPTLDAPCPGQPSDYDRTLDVVPRDDEASDARAPLYGRQATPHRNRDAELGFWLGGDSRAAERFWTQGHEALESNRTAEGEHGQGESTDPLAVALGSSDGANSRLGRALAEALEQPSPGARLLRLLELYSDHPERPAVLYHLAVQARSAGNQDIARMASERLRRGSPECYQQLCELTPEPQPPPAIAREPEPSLSETLPRSAQPVSPGTYEPPPARWLTRSAIAIAATVTAGVLAGALLGVVGL